MNGRIVFTTIESKVLANNFLGDSSERQAIVYLPQAYDAESTAHFPVAYFLHGFTGSALSYLNVAPFAPNVPERLDGMIERGSVPPFIAVFIDGWTKLGGTQWDNSPVLGNFRDHVVAEVVPHIDRNFRTVAEAAGRLVLGKSSGGYGSLVMGRYHPDVFAHVACHSGDAYFEYCYLPDFPKAAASLQGKELNDWFAEFLDRGWNSKLRGDDHTIINVVAMAAAYTSNLEMPLGVELPFDLSTGQMIDGVWQKWLERDPVRFVPKALDAFRKLQSIYIECGSHDEFHLRWGARMVSQILREAEIPVHHEEFDGGHMGINYRYEASLSKVVPRLRRG